jgi:hypothetical protein
MRGGCRSPLAVSGFRLRARLGFSIPSSPRPARHYPRFWIRRPSSGRRRDLNPPDHHVAQRTLRVDPSLCHASVLSPLGGFPLDFSLTIAATGSPVPRESLSQAHAAFMPVTAEAVSRRRLDWVPGQRLSLVLVTFLRFRHLISGSLAFVFLARI